MQILASKKLPSHTERSQTWAFVDVASENIEDINDALGYSHYKTETRGERTVESARIVAEVWSCF